MKDSTIILVKIDNEFINDVLHNTIEELIYVKPGLKVTEIKEIMNKLEGFGTDITLILEGSKNPIKKGLADLESLNIIKTIIHDIDIKFVDKIEICMIITDNVCLFFPPAIVSSNSIREGFFNAILLTGNIINRLKPVITGREINNTTIVDVDQNNQLTITLKDMMPDMHLSFDSIIEDIQFIDSSPIEMIKFLEFDGDSDELGREEIIRRIDSIIKEVYEEQELEDTPNEFDYYKKNFELLKIRYSGIDLSRKSLNLNSFYNILNTNSRKLKSTWSILDKEDELITNYRNILKKEQLKLFDIYKESIIDGGRHGKVINKEIKKQLTDEIKIMVKDHKECIIKGNTTSKDNTFYKYINTYENREYLNIKLEESKIELINYLVDQVKNPNDILRYKNLFDYDTREKIFNSEFSQDEVVKYFIENYVDKILEFPNLETIVEKIDINFDVYGITKDLLLSDERLLQNLRKICNVN